MKNTSGTTVVELVLYMGLLSIFILALSNLFSQILNTQTRSAAVSLVQTNGNFLLTRLTHDINQANDIIAPVAIGDSLVSFTLKVGSSLSTYSLNNGRLQLNDGTNIYNLNDADTAISNLIALRLGNSGGKNGLRLSFSVTSLVVDNTGIKSADFKTFANLR